MKTRPVCVEPTHNPPKEFFDHDRYTSGKRVHKCRKCHKTMTYVWEAEYDGTDKA